MVLFRSVLAGCAGIGLVIGSVVCVAVPCGDVEAGKRTKAPHVWWAADSSWAVMGFGKLRAGLAEEILQKKPAGVEGLKFFEMEVDSPAVYLGFEVDLKRLERVVFSKGSRFVLWTKNGRRLESEVVLFCPDMEQTSVFDSRKRAVVVSRLSVYCHAENGCPCGWVKFPRGSVEVGDITGFEVLGAVVQSGDGGTK